MSRGEIFGVIAILVLAVLIGWCANCHTYPDLDQRDAWGHLTK